MRNRFVAAALVMGALFLGMSALSYAKSPKPGENRFNVKQVQTAKHSGVFLTDTESDRQITIMNGTDGSGGAFIALYGSKTVASEPKLVISEQGLQVLRSDGKKVYISLDELAQLDRLNEPEVSQAVWLPPGRLIQTSN